MPGKFKLTLDGQTKVIEDSPDNLTKIRKLKAQGVEYSLTPVEDDEQESPSAAEPTPAPIVNSAPVNTQPPVERDTDDVWTGAKAGWGNAYGGLIDAAKSIASGAQDVGRGVRKGATLGWDDELARLGGQLGSRLAGGRDASNTYAGATPGEALEQETIAGNQESEERSPWLYGAGRVAGGVGTTSALMAPVVGVGAGASAFGRALSAPQLGSKVAQLATRLAGRGVAPAVEGATSTAGAADGANAMLRSRYGVEAANAGKLLHPGQAANATLAEAEAASEAAIQAAGQNAIRNMGLQPSVGGAVQAQAQQAAANAGNFMRGMTAAGAAGLAGSGAGAGEAKPGERMEGASGGFTLGAGLQGGLSALGTGAEAAAPSLRALATRIRNAVAAPNKTMVKNLQERYGTDAIDDLMGEWLEKYGGESSKSRKASDYARILKEKLGQQQSKISQLDDEVGNQAQRPFQWDEDAAIESLPKPPPGKVNEMVRPEWDQAVQDIHAGAESAAESAGTQGQANVAGAKQRIAKLISKKVPDSDQVVTNPAAAVNDLGALRTRAGAYGDDAFGPVFAREDGATNEAALDAWKRTKDIQNKLYSEQTTPQQMDQFYTSNKDFSEMKALEEVLKSVTAGEGSSHLGPELVSGVASGALGGGATAMAAGGNPIAGAAVGAQANTGSGSTSTLKRFMNSSGFKDLQANAARGMGYYADKLGQALTAPSKTTMTANALAQNSGGGQEASEPITSTDKVMRALETDPESLGQFRAKLEPFMNDPEDLAHEVERLEQDDQQGQAFRTLPVFGGNR